MNGMRTIVTITPLKVEADSRTFKQAASMKRFGFLSVMVEAETSLDNDTLRRNPFVNPSPGEEVNS